MKSFLFRSVGAIAVLGSLLAMLSCARDQQLVSISIEPSAQTFGAPDPTANVQLRALGTYIHPPATKDITGQATWASDDPEVAIVNSTGLLSPSGLDCGGALVSATVQTNTSGSRTSSGALVTSAIVVTVNDISVPGCPGFSGSSSQPTLTVDFAGTGTGVVNSSPAGLGCSSACSANFASGTVVTLTAAPTGASTFGSWNGCDSISGTTCTVTLNSNRTVTVTFNP
jgi:List-Bact-rpt repeat protein/Big-like domain-containing protein